MNAAEVLDRSLDPQGLGHELLCEWAPWARDESEGRSSWTVKPRVDHGHHGDPPERWYVINKIISHLLHREPDYRRVVKPYYLGERPAWEIAKSIGRTEIGVKTTILHVCWLVEREYVDFVAARR